MKTFGIILLIMLVIFGLGAKAFLDHASPEHEHSYGEWTTKTPATCTEAGVEVRVCECNDEETREIPATGHTYGEWETKTPANCTDAEVEARKCACGAEETREGDAANGHSFGAWQTRTEPTCESAGEEFRACACGAEETKILDAKDHTFGEWETKTPANCTDAEVEVRKCACGAEETREGDAANGHSFGAWQTRTEPTCESAGEEFRACACGAEETKILDAKDHTFGEWETKTPANCTDAEVEVRKCACGEEETREGDAATGHTYTSISATYNKESAMEHDVVSLSDLTVTATCGCDYSTVVTEGITLENNTLALGDNTVTVKFGDLSTTVSLNAVKFNKVVNVIVKDDTLVYSGSGYQDKNYSGEKTITIYGGNDASGNRRVLFRYNFSDLLAEALLNNYKDEAKVQFTFTIVEGSADNTTKFTFKAYPIDETRSDADFGVLTWKNYDKEYNFGWGKADGFVEKEAGHPAVSIEGNQIVITLTYREIEKYIDADGNALFVFAAWTSGIKIATIENENEDIRPIAKVILNDEHRHAFIEKAAEDKYLVSANCGEKAKYYMSCSCGEAGTKTFEHGEVIEHSYGDWTETQAPTCTVEGINAKTCGKCGDVQTENIPVIAHSYNTVVTPPTCTAEGYTTYTCSCGDVYVADKVDAKGHTYGEWFFDESYHWQACSCGDVANKATHAGGEATETEQAVCDTCKQPYGGLASHVHNHNASVTEPTCTEAGYTTYTCACGDVYTADEVAATGHTYGEWETVHPATCEGDEVLVHYCACGESETGKGDLAFGHDMQTNYDENNHWTECAHNCGKSTDPEAHFGGEATETKKAVCEGCDQSYGELKPAEKKEYTINGTVKDDTFVYSSWTNTDLSKREYLRVYNSDSRTYFRYNFSDILGNADFVADKENAVVTFTFYFMTESFDYVNSSGQNKTMTVATPTDSSTVIFRGFNTNTSSIDTDFSSITWTSVNTGNEYNDIHYASGADIVNSTMNTENAKYENNVLTITVKYSDIEQYINSETGDALFVITTKTKSAFVYSIESEYKPTVSVTYTK